VSDRQRQSRRWTGAFAVPLLAVLLLAVPATAHAQRVATRRIGVSWEDGIPRVTFSARDVINDHVRRELRSGLQRTLVTTIFAYRQGGGRPIAASVRRCHVVYDMWEETYRVQVQTPESDRTQFVDSFDDAVQRCVVFREVPVGTSSDYTRYSEQSIYFGVLVEFQPVSRETVERIRRLLARGGGLDDERVFGSFVSMFVNREIGEADRVVRFRSQALAVP